MVRYIHIEVVELVGEGDNHDHIHLCDIVRETDETAESIAKNISIDVCSCNIDGSSFGCEENGEPAIFTYSEKLYYKQRIKELEEEIQVLKFNH